MKNIRIVPYGGLGNRMFQFMFARALQKRVPEAGINGLHLPEWGLTIPRVPLVGGPAITIKHHNVPVGSLVRTMRSVDRFDLMRYPRTSMR